MFNEGGNLIFEGEMVNGVSLDKKYYGNFEYGILFLEENTHGQKYF